MYIPSDHIIPFGGVFGLTTRRASRATTPYGDPKDYTFHVSNLLSDAAYHRGDYAAHVYYDTEERWRNRGFWNDANAVDFQSWWSDDTHQTHVPRGEWFTAQGRVKMNTFDSSGVGRRDGEIAAWLNGKLVFRKNNIRFSTSDDPGGFSMALLTSQYGGSCSTAAQDQSEYFDNLIVWVP